MLTDGWEKPPIIGTIFCFDSTTTLTEKNIFSGRKRAKSSALVVDGSHRRVSVRPLSFECVCVCVVACSCACLRVTLMGGRSHSSSSRTCRGVGKMGGGAIFKDVTKSVPIVVHTACTPHRKSSSTLPYSHLGGEHYVKWELGW